MSLVASATMSPRFCRVACRGVHRPPISFGSLRYRFKSMALSPIDRKCHYPRNLSQPRARGNRLQARARGLAFRCPARLRGSCAARVVVVRFRVFRVGALLLGCRVVAWALVLARNCEKLPLGFLLACFPCFSRFREGLAPLEAWIESRRGYPGLWGTMGAKRPTGRGAHGGPARV